MGWMLCMDSEIMCNIEAKKEALIYGLCYTEVCRHGPTSKRRVQKGLWVYYIYITTDEIELRGRASAPICALYIYSTRLASKVDTAIRYPKGWSTRTRPCTTDQPCSPHERAHCAPSSTRKSFGRNGCSRAIVRLQEEGVGPASLGGACKWKR